MSKNKSDDCCHIKMPDKRKSNTRTKHHPIETEYSKIF